MKTEEEVNLRSTNKSQTSDYQPIRIYIDTTYLDSQDIENITKSKTIKNMKEVATMISLLLRVEPKSYLVLIFDIKKILPSR